MSDSIRLWVGVDAEWRAVLFPKGKEAKDKDSYKVGNGAATLQVCTADLYHFSPFSLPFLSLSSPLPRPDFALSSSLSLSFLSLTSP